jgi:hypothetical protein
MLEILHLHKFNVQLDDRQSPIHSFRGRPEIEGPQFFSQFLSSFRVPYPGQQAA